MDFWDKYKFALDGSHFNYKGRYDEKISVHDMDGNDVKNFKLVLTEISKELDIVIEPYYDYEYEYWLAGMYIDESTKVSDLMNEKGLVYEWYVIFLI